MMTKRSQALLAVVLMLSALLPLAPAPVAHAAAAMRIRIGVTQDGLVRITPSDLTAQGINVSSLDPRTFSMVSLGSPVAIRVTGEADGLFNGADSIEFFGRQFRGPQMEQKYTDERVYWLDAGGTAGPRVQDVAAQPLHDQTPPTDFATTVHAEVDWRWFAHETLTLDTDDTWFWDRLVTSAPIPGITASLAYTVPYPAGGSTAALRLEMVTGSATANVDPNHRTTITVNGTRITDQSWFAAAPQARRVFSAAVPAGVLRSGLNDVALGVINPAGVSSDVAYPNFWEVDYRRQFRAWQGQLDFKSEAGGTREYRSTGWSTGQVAIWDITSPNMPQRLTGAEAAGGEVLFRSNAPAGERYWLQENGLFAKPDSIKLRPDTGLRQPAGGADVVIVTPAVLRSQAERLATWHTQHGRRALVADIQDIYDEFSNGIRIPRAVPAMLAWAYQHWDGAPPAYLTLVGDGDWDMKKLNPARYTPGPNYIPPYLAFVDPWAGEVAADALYGDINGDGVPDVAVGRLPVNSLAEAQAVIDKIVAYDESVRSQDWQRRTLFVAGQPDSAGNFWALSDDAITNGLPADLAATPPQRAYLGATEWPDVASVRRVITDSLNSGLLMLQYGGHGSTNAWGGTIWQTSDVASLAPNAHLPVVMVFNCLDGYFDDPRAGQSSMAETMLRQPGAGSVAGISPSGMGLTDDQQNFRLLFMHAVFDEGVRDLGQALLLTKQRFHQQYGDNYLIPTMTLFGDPALRLPRPAGVTSYGLALTPVAAQATGPAGVAVRYWLRVTNTGSADDTFTIATSGGSWPSHPMQTSVHLAPDASASFQVEVAVPAGAAYKSHNITTVTVTSQGGGTAQSAELTTTVGLGPKAFLPIMQRGR